MCDKKGMILIESLLFLLIVTIMCSLVYLGIVAYHKAQDKNDGYDQDDMLDVYEKS